MRARGCLARDRQFLSRQVADTFGGYALSQLKRIRGHRAWLLDPPERPPKRSEFGLPDKPLLPGDQMGAARALLDRPESDVFEELSPNFIDVLDRERRYQSARAHWAQYQGWLTHRNPDRAVLEARFGYDSKHAMHLVRLQRMAVEILETGVVPVHREDRDELLAIRDGALSYDELVERSEALSLQIRAARGQSSLPERPDKVALDELCTSLVGEVLSEITE